MLSVQSLTSRSDHGALGALEILYANPVNNVLELARLNMYVQLVRSA